MRRFQLLPDTHAHLDAAEFRDDLDEVIARAQNAGVCRILSVGEDLASSQRAVELAQRYEIVYAAVGVHPHCAQKFESESLEIEGLLDEEKVVAVGEIGLDYVRDEATRDTQRSVFAQQLAWARARELPVSVHNREADTDVLEILGKTPGPTVLHCFSGTPAIAVRAIREGYHLSFAGNTTFPKSESLREAAALVPDDRLLVETDSPVLAPQTARGRRNEPARVVETASLLASLRGVTLESLSSTMWSSANCVFRWGAP
ncbi:MAG TPA: TatD family hydrolase [Chloroflexota bacterium]